jgi:EAL domain-containing protein (putative c-di-GMP-specific phosphodiesterase class I)
MADKLKEKIKIEKLLRDALKENGFTLLYQPQVSTFTGNILGFEALLRLKAHEISPIHFIPLAEEIGIIIEIGRWVTKEVVKQLKTRKEKGGELKPIAINFSAQQLHDSGYIEFLKALLEKEKISGEYLSIEITESIFLDKKDETITFLHKLKDLGIKIALDDFGVGYSSLSYLTFLPVDKIKLDKTLNDKFLIMDDIMVISSIISLAHSLSLEVIAEGIESIEQYLRLKEAGCDCIQGYLFSKPLDIESIDRIYNDNLVQKLQKNIKFCKEERL